MIRHLTVAVPRYEVPRDGLDPVGLKQFEKITGILHTNRFEGTTEEMICRAIDASGVNIKDIGALMVVTQSPDRLSPCMAVGIHEYLKLPNHVPAFDINHACDGWPFALWIASKLGGKKSSVMVICADRLRYAKTPLESLIFSDSVSITVVEPNGFNGGDFKFLTDGSAVHNLYCGLNGQMDMNGNAVFDFVTTKIPTFIKDWAEQYNPDWFVPHQANRSMNKILAQRIGMNYLSSIEMYGNQSMNSIPTAITLEEQACLGKRLLTCGFGAGYTATAHLLDWPEQMVSKIVRI